jgi:diguanylate cyclase (GGDEF)-like protein
MTLYRQLILIIIALFSACFLVTVTISTGNLRGFLEEQLESHAQDTATSLGLSLSPYMQSNDAAVMNSMVDAIFDRGYYKAVSVIAVDGKPLIERNDPVTNKGVPSWFVDYIDLQLPTAEAMVMSGWKQAATVRVASHPGHAYQELWKNSRDTFMSFSLTAITTILLGILAVHLLLKPLKRVETQAAAICRKDFVIQEKLPRTRELRRVVEAMNRLSRKIEDIFTEQSTLSERLREQAYKDPVTGVGNRRYFDRQLQASLESHEESSGGAVLLLELVHLDHINTASGYQAGDALLQRTAERIQARLAGFRKGILARISGGGFGIVVEDIDSREADELADSLSKDLLQLHAERLVEDRNIAAIGLTMWKSGDNLSGVLAEADNALRSAQVIGDNAWYRYEAPVSEQPPIRGAAQWQAYLGHIIGSANAALFAQPVVEFTGTGNKLLHKEVFLRLPEENGDFMAGGVFMPMAERTGLATELDRLAIEKVLDYLSANPVDPCRYAINLSATSLHDAALVEWLCNRLQADPGNGRRISFEFSEFGVLRSIETSRTVVDRLSALGCACGIDHFGGGFNSFGYLRSIKVRYLKIDGGYTRNIDKEADHQFFIRTLADTAHSVSIRVFAEAVETAEQLHAIRALNVDGVQGHLIGKPDFLQLASTWRITGCHHRPQTVARKENCSN